MRIILSKERDMQDHEMRFSEYLDAKDMKYTKPRRLILEAVFAMHEHFDVEQLYERIKGVTSDVSRATIYRTIPHLIGAGLIQQSVRNASRDVYEHIYGHPKHIHWICQHCQAVIETDMEELMPLVESSASQMKFEIEDLKINIKGLCWKCKLNENENQ